LRYVAEPGHTGYADVAVRLVGALRADGIRVALRGITLPGTIGPTELVAHERDLQPVERVARNAPTVVHLVAEHVPWVRAALGPGPLIAHTVWETTRLPAAWPTLLNATDRVIVPSEWNREIFRTSGVTADIAVVPHIACQPDVGDGGAVLGLDPHTFAFYTIGRWDERKGLFDVVRAYLDAFTGDDDVVLVVKTGRTIEMPPVPEGDATSRRIRTTSWQLASIVGRYRNPAHVVLATGMWHTAQIAGLHARGDCFVTMARAEGWGVGAFDACVYGNPVVATGWGGHLEFLDAEGASLVESRLVAVESSAPLSYSPDQRWALPSVDHAVELMRQIHRDPAAARRRAASLGARVAATFAPDVVAGRFRRAMAGFDIG
jgi:glycosyltransferase involved in cell wall biosynthesis